LSAQVPCEAANKEINIEDRILIAMKQGETIAGMIPPPSVYHFKLFHLDSDDLDLTAAVIVWHRWTRHIPQMPFTRSSRKTR
jgi:hypothetical protein